MIEYAHTGVLIFVALVLWRHMKDETKALNDISAQNWIMIQTMNEIAWLMSRDPDVRRQLAEGLTMPPTLRAKIREWDRYHDSVYGASKSG